MKSYNLRMFPRQMNLSYFLYTEIIQKAKKDGYWILYYFLQFLQIIYSRQILQIKAYYLL